jgi:hypothetical protein
MQPVKGRGRIDASFAWPRQQCSETLGHVLTKDIGTPLFLPHKNGVQNCLCLVHGKPVWWGLCWTTHTSSFLCNDVMSQGWKK